MSNQNKIEIVKSGDVRRSKLYYLRGRSGKSARINEKNIYNEKTENKQDQKNDINKLLKCAGKVGKNSLEKAKNKALLEMLYGSGLRVSELVSLKKSSFYGNPELILIKGKGRKERVVPISRRAKFSIKKYLKLMGESESNIYQNDFLFPSKSKNGFLNREKFFLIIKEIVFAIKF